MNMGKTNKSNLREGKTLAEVVKNTNVCLTKIFPLCIFLFPLFKYSTNPLCSRCSLTPSFPKAGLTLNDWYDTTCMIQLLAVTANSKFSESIS